MTPAGSTRTTSAPKSDRTTGEHRVKNFLTRCSKPKRLTSAEGPRGKTGELQWGRQTGASGTNRGLQQRTSTTRIPASGRWSSMVECGRVERRAGAMRGHSPRSGTGGCGRRRLHPELVPTRHARSPAAHTFVLDEDLLQRLTFIASQAFGDGVLNRRVLGSRTGGSTTQSCESSCSPVRRLQVAKVSQGLYEPPIKRKRTLVGVLGGLALGLLLCGEARGSGSELS